MQFIYPAVFKKHEKGYTGYFPDLEGCEVSGDTLDEVLEEARLACADWITVELEEDAPVLPPVTDIEDIVLKEHEFARRICVTIRLYDGWDE